MMTNENNLPVTPAPETTEPIVAETEGKKGKKKKKEDDYTNPNNRKFTVSAIVILSLAAVFIAFLAIFVFVGNTWFKTVSLEDPDGLGSTYSEEQKQAAADAVVDYFRTEQAGSILQEVTYSEKFSRQTGLISFGGKFYAMFTSIKDIDAPCLVKKNWHWDVELDSATGEYHVVSYGINRDLSVIGEEETEAADVPPATVPDFFE